MDVAIEALPDRYEYVSVISSGGFGDVLAVRDGLTGSVVALKVLKAFSNRMAKAFRVEFTKLSSLNHPNLVSVYDYGILDSGKPYFTMELVSGEDLRGFFKEGANLKYLPDVITQSLFALRYLHSKNLLHGDIKPENIMVTSDGNVKLLDFGLSVRKGTRRRKLSGTRGYLAPETIRSGRYGETSDLYALGISLLECILGKREGIDNISEVLSSMLSDAGLKNASSIASFILALCSPEVEERSEDADQAILLLELSLRRSGEAQAIDFDDIFVGRKKEIRYGGRFLRGEQDKRVLIIEGARGAGKRALARGIKRRAQVEGFVTIGLKGSEHISSPVRELFGLLARNLEGGEGGRLMRRVDRIYRAFEQRGFGERFSNIYRVDLYLNLSKLLIEYSKRKKVLIILEDIESFEKDFLSFISQLEQVLLTDSVDTILIMGTLNIDRKVKLQSDLDDIGEHELTCSITVPPLSKGEVRELIGQAFNAGLFLDEEIERILEKTDGLPLLITELLKQLISKGLIYCDERGWHRKGAIDLNIPVLSTVDDVFIEKWRGLKRDEKMAIRIIAFFDSDVTLKMLPYLAKVDMCMLNRFVELGILKVEGGRVGFVSPLFREAVRKRTRADVRRKVCLSIAAFLESLKRRDVVKIARYYIESNSPDLAYKYGLEAVKILTSRNELYLAYDYLLKLKRVLERSKRKDELVSVLDQLVQLEELFGQVEETIRDYEFIISNTRSISTKAMATMNLGIILLSNKGDINKCYSLLKKARALSRKTNDKRLIALTLARYAETRRGKEKERILLKALDMAKDVDINVYSIALYKLIGYYRIVGRINSAIKYFNKALLIVNKLSYDNRMTLLIELYIYKFYTSDYKFITDYFGKLYGFSNVVLSYYEKSTLAMMLGGINYVLANYTRMISSLNNALSIFTAQKAYMPMIRVYYNLLLAYRSIANYEKCLEMLDTIRKLEKKNKSGYYLLSNTIAGIITYSLLGKYFKNGYKHMMLKYKRAALQREDFLMLGHYYYAGCYNKYSNFNLKRSLKNVGEAIKCYRKINSRDDLCEALLKKAIILCELGEPKRAGVCIKKAWEIYGEIHCEYLKPQLYLARGMVERMNGTDEAIGSLREGLRVSKRQMTREQTWQIQREIALYYRGRRHLKRAIKYYRDAVETIKQITETIPTEEIKVSYLEVPLRKRVFEEIRELKREVGG